MKEGVNFGDFEADERMVLNASYTCGPDSNALGQGPVARS
jgi:hypothetical protein